MVHHNDDAMRETRGQGGLAGRTRRRWGRAATAALGMVMCLATAPAGHAAESAHGLASDTGSPGPNSSWSSRDAAAYWTAKRMAAAAPADDGTESQGDGAPAEDGTPAQGDSAPAEDGTPAQDDTAPSDGGTPDQSATTPPDTGTPDQSATPPAVDAPSPSATAAPGSGTPTKHPAPAQHPSTAQHPATAEHFDGVPSVGVLFSVDGDARAHHCTASVVHSPHRNLILTAGHCRMGSRAAFVPQYRSGADSQPYGVWAITKTFAYPDRGTTGGKADLDFTFATVAPSVDGKALEEVTGGNILAPTPGYANDVTVIGYPTVRHDPADQAVRCTARTARLAGTNQLRMECGGFYGGTSGSPWLADFDEESGTGRLIGLIAGVNGGGPKGPDNDRISYSPYFGGKILSLYSRAAKG
ncbi:hypothetical protein AB0C96_30460 [Streptomyces sp. NPDC048506]|uniref:trypsin-like serine peptidase n=1 Tax=Streptomyces sp. NPDC048506 TaxID=3155028 RepID=UPI0034240D9D